MGEVETKLADWQTFFTCHRIHTQCHPTLHVCEREHLQHALSYTICTYIGGTCVFSHLGFPQKYKKLRTIHRVETPDRDSHMLQHITTIIAIKWCHSILQ